MSHDTIDLSRRLADAAKAVDRFYHPDMYRLLETIHANTLLILQREKTIMSALDDLKAAVAQLSTDVANEITALEAALSSNNDAAIEESVANLKQLSANLQASVAPKPAAQPPQA